MCKKQKFYVVKQSDENIASALIFSRKTPVLDEKKNSFPKSPQQAYERLSPYALEGARGQLLEITIRPLTKMSKIKNHPKKNKK